MLSMQELIEIEQKLRTIIDHTQQELQAVQLLIKGHELRNERPDSSKKQSIAQAMKYQIERFQGNVFTSSQLTEKLISAGIKSEAEKAKLHSIVAHYLKKLIDANKIERRNVDPNSPRGRFEYWSRKN